MPKSVKYIRMAAPLLFLLIFYFFFSQYAAQETSFLSYPKVSEPQSGRIVPFEVKGRIVYITREEEVSHRRYQIEFFGLIGAFFIAAMIAKNRKPKQPSY